MRILRERCIQEFFHVLTVVIVVSSGLWAQGTDYKIAPELMGVLAEDADATAPFFVVFGDRANLKPAYQITDRLARARFVELALRAVADRSQAGVRGFLQGRRVDFIPFWIENKIYVREGTLDLARALARMPEVAAILPEMVYTVPEPQANGPAVQGIEWNINKIRAPEVWSTGNRGEGIVVANIDTGVQHTHPALVNQYRGAGGTHLGNWKDPTGVCGSTPCDNNGHGTHTMGTIVGDDGQGSQIGVAPGARWIACKGCRTGSCFSNHLTTCAQWIVNPDGTAPPHVVNNSWGGGGGNSWYQSYIQSWIAAGIFPAFSNGNSGPNCNTSSSPGDYPESVSAGATDINDVIAGFSSRGLSAFGVTKPDLAAPGVNIRSSYPTNSYAFGSGTSMASPHVAGTVALVWAGTDLDGNIAGTEQALKDSSTILASSTQTCGGIPVGASPNNVYGWGRIDAFSALGGGEPPPPPPPNEPPTVSITNPLNGSSFDCDTPITFTGTANDPENDDLTASINWTDNGIWFGTGGIVVKSFACTDAGNHNITSTATDRGGLSDTDTITISIVDPSLPTAPQNLIAAVNGSDVSLSWDDTSYEDGYYVERKKKGGSWSRIAPLEANDTDHSDSPGKGNWDYRVQAFKSSNVSPYSNIVSVRIR